ncbi:MAG TPA: MMPL family transporter [Thermoanaerobaculia bacterium]|nr:MMPL family transporter [Thermoanaerobaculia bacterium]
MNIVRVVEWITEQGLRRPGRVVMVAALLLLLALGAITRLRLDPDLLNLFPEGDPVLSDFRRVLEEMGTLDYHVAVVDIPAGAEFDDHSRYVDDLAGRFEKSPHFEHVMYRIPDVLEFIDELIPRALLLLGPEHLPVVAEALTDEAIRERIEQNRAMLQTPQSTAMEGLVRHDPLGILRLFLGKLGSAGEGFRIDAMSGYYLSADHTTALIIMQPRKPPQDLDFTRAVMADSEAIVRETTAAWTAAGGGQPPLVRFTGGYAIAIDDAELIRKDIIVNVTASLAGVLLLFLFAFRRPVTLLFASVPMLMAVGLTFGFAGLAIGEITSASAGFAALLAGLGIDFITVLYGRFVEERSSGVEPEESVRRMARSTMPAVVIAAITTSATFAAFMVTEFRGMAQLGLLTAVGILVFLACVVFLLPALIGWAERRAKKRPHYFHHSFGAHHLVRAALARPWVTIAVWIVVTLGASVFALRVGFSGNVQSLRAAGNRGMMMQEYVTDKFGQSFEFMMFVVRGRDAEEALARTAALRHELDALVRQGEIASYQSIATFIPPAAEQREVIRALETGRDDHFSYSRIEATFRDALVENGFRPSSYDDWFPLLQRMLAPREIVTPASLPDELRDFTARFLKDVDSGYTSVVYLYPVGGTWPRTVPRGLLATAARQTDATLTGINLVSERLRDIVAADATGATALAIGLVFIMLAVMLRSIGRALFVFLPLIVGAVGMLGIMAALKLDFNYMNVFVGLMLVGVATDYALYMLQRFTESREHFAEHAAETGKAVMMAAVTTIVGYGSYALSHYPGLRSMGYAATFGVGTSALAALTLVPAILMVVSRRRASGLGPRTHPPPSPDPES